MGNSYVAGTFGGQAVFGIATLTNRGWSDAFVAKYDSRGTCLWVRQIGATVPNPVQFGPTNTPWGIAVDSQGNAYVVGDCKGRTLLDNIEIIPVNDGRVRMFLAKYSSQGTVLWAKSYDAGTPGGVATDTDGSLYVAHTDALGSPIAAVSKIDEQGNMLWTRGVRNGGLINYGGGGGVHVRVGPYHEVYLHSSYVYGASIDVGASGSSPLSNAGLLNTGIANKAVFLARYTTAGTLDWVRTGYSPGETSYNAGLAVDSAGNAFITGYTMSGGMVFGSLVLAAHGNWDTYVVKYDARGQVVWGHQEGSARLDRGVGIAVDEVGNAYLLGTFYSGLAAFSNVTLNGVASQYNNLALVKYDPQGQALWAITQQGAGDLAPWGLAANRNGDVYVIADVWNAARLGSLTMTVSGGPSSGHLESLIAKLKSNLPVTSSGGETGAPGAGMGTPTAEVRIPNIITPNGDGQNDQFKTLGLAAGTWRLSVYNRWGMQVFDTPNYQQDWQAEGMGAGLYYYVLANTTGQMRKGWLEVRR
ncbi:gliding motility-associated C-terminal domain-containing protein [Hymenobacter monticola]|uniref:Gliding motility-associated C-terminal domain-containing protein n=1 Tax=Hymenobacter monticola TaxID=1705399 RepID=A0ABY4BCZ2_9BACT|nr:gliding motility-associated C-terminal domain-containing protein [Hymenobacter monticola]UOE35653.1 gliding motility-associated C-terminal domain-containing protein [Hymenobacter monticola]